MSDSRERISAPNRPSITIPPLRPPSEALAPTTTSPSPMTIVSNFFADNFPDMGSDFRGSFSQLLAGAMVSPSTVSFFGDGSSLPDRPVDGNSGLGFKQNRPAELTVPVQAPISPLFPISPGFSPSAFFNSPTAGFFSSALSPFGMSHQQALAQVTAQAALSQSVFPSTSSAPPSMDQVMMSQQPFSFSSPAQDPSISLSITEPTKQRASKPPQDSRVDTRVNIPLPAPVDKPADDGYNWRKYGQKQVKGSEYPRSYYRCTNSICPVKKKVERSKNGHITEIIYKGQHNHDPPQPSRRGRDNSNIDNDSKWSNGAEDSAQATSIQLHGPSDSEESGDGYQGFDENDDEEEPNAKRRNTGAGTSEAGLSQKTVTEPKIIVQTRSQVDLLDDGYRWRKYGQKVVKGNTNPRSYYKCTTTGCGVRKHVERSSTDQDAVITTYEGKHSHDVPLGRNNGGGKATQQTVTRKQVSVNEIDYENKDQMPIGFLRLKEEQGLI
uniref:WRKY transcription factor n=1 Tax=Fagopyrum tataricum TaxID=62330 RepID=A0A4V1I1W3_FAGTA|nr:WRKY transcription factor [Fagopyrum tataricum]